MDSRDAMRKKYPDAIKERIQCGELTADEVIARLEAAVEAELLKPLADMDKEFVLACQDLLYDLLVSEPYVSKQPEYERMLIQEIQKRNKAKVMRRRIGCIVCAVAAVFVLLMVGDGLLYREWLSGNSTDDEQKYRIEGNVLNPNLVADGKASHYVEGEDFSTDDFDDVIAFWGSAPSMPTLLPEGWVLTEYTCMHGLDNLWVSVKYADIDSLILYDIKLFEDVESATLELEQIDSGTLATIGKREVYIAENTNNSLISWIEGNTSYSLFAPLTLDEMTHFIESIE